MQSLVARYAPWYEQMVQSTFRHHLDIIVVLAVKDLKVRYRTSVLGFVWSLLNPLAYMTILTLVFAILLRVNVPDYAPWFLTGILIWRFFSLGTSQGLFSIVGNPSLVNKLYLPRYLIVFANNIANFIGASLEFIVFLPLLVLLGAHISIQLLWLPFLLLIELAIVFGLSLFLASVMVEFRDLYQLWDIALQLGFFLSPIVYDITLIPARYRFAYSLNPVTRLISAARGIVLSNRSPLRSDHVVLITAAMILLIVGSQVFMVLNRKFAEDL